MSNSQHGYAPLTTHLVFVLIAATVHIYVTNMIFFHPNLPEMKKYF